MTISQKIEAAKIWINLLILFTPVVIINLFSSHPQKKIIILLMIFPIIIVVPLTIYVTKHMDDWLQFCYPKQV